MQELTRAPPSRQRRSAMTDESVVLTEARGAVLVITINRPDARNSMNKAAAEAMGVGLFAGAGALLRLPRRVGLGQAALLALTGKPISGEEGHRIGLVDRLVDPGGALTEALALAETIAANAPLALAASKAILVDGFTKPDAEFWPWQQQ